MNDAENPIRYKCLACRRIGRQWEFENNEPIICLSCPQCGNKQVAEITENFKSIEESIFKPVDITPKPHPEKELINPKSYIKELKSTIFNTARDGGG